MSLKIVVPDDFPTALTGSAAESRLRALGNVTVHTERGADQEAELIRRIGDAEVVINIRAYAKFTDSVLARCPRLRLISIWGTGTDNADLAACRARGVAVTNTPGVNARAVAEWIVDGRPSMDLSLFDPARFAGRLPPLPGERIDTGRTDAE